MVCKNKGVIFTIANLNLADDVKFASFQGVVINLYRTNITGLK